MKIRNFTRFPYHVLLWLDKAGREHCSLLVKATCVLATGMLAEEQRPIVMADVMGPKHTLARPSDLAPSRTGTNVIVRGCIRAPGGEPADRVHASIRVGRVERRLVGFGPRRWRREGAGWAASPPEPFISLPATLEHAFGGEGFSANPAGVGVLSAGISPEDAPLARIEDPMSPVCAPEDRPMPVALDALPPSFAPRVERVGTYDDAWKRRRAPYPPDDFDERHFDAAPDPLVARPFLRGNEPIELEGLSHGGPILTRLPRVPIRMETNAPRVLPELDLVVIDLDADRIELTFRRSFDVTRLGIALPTVNLIELRDFRPRARHA